MGRLYGSLLVLGLIFSAAVGFFAAALYGLDWVWAVVGAGVGLVFLALGGLLVPPTRAVIPTRWTKAANGLLQFFGAFCTLEVMIMALIGWIVGNRSYNHDLGYEVLGIFVFLGLLGVGIQGAIGTFFRFLYLRNQLIAEDRALRAAEHHAGGAHAPHGAHA